MALGIGVAVCVFGLLLGLFKYSVIRDIARGEPSGGVPVLDFVLLVPLPLSVGLFFVLVHFGAYPFPYFGVVLYLALAALLAGVMALEYRSGARERLPTRTAVEGDPGGPEHSERGAPRMALHPAELTPIAGLAESFRPGVVLDSRYRLDAVAGEGRLGVTWRAVDLLWAEGEGYERPIALQLTHLSRHEAGERFLAFQQVLARQQGIAHPNILTILDLDLSGDAGVLRVVSQWASCGSLARVMGPARPATPPDTDIASAWIRQLAEGLEYAHGRGLVHGNLHPGKCFLCKGGWTPPDTPLAELEVQVSGFTAVLPRLSSVDSASTSDGDGPVEGAAVFAGPSPSGAPYASPALLGGKPPGPEDDVYSLAVIGYELLSGVHPFGGVDVVSASKAGVAIAQVPGLERWQNDWLAGLLRDGPGPQTIDTAAAFVKSLWPSSPWARLWRPVAARLVARGRRRPAA